MECQKPAADHALIAFAILLFLGLQNLSLVLAFLGNVLTLFAPFLVGLCIAFVLNVPMRFLENKILTRKHPKHPPKKFWLAMKRPLSLVLTLLFVAGILFVILFLIIPELSRTFQKMAEDVPLFLQQVQQWMEGEMEESSQFGQWLSQLEVDWNTIGQQLMAMLEGGAGGLINLTVNAITSMVGAIVTFVLGFVFALYVLLQKEKLAAQSKRAMAAYLPDPAVNKILSIGELSDKTFSSFLSGQCFGIGNFRRFVFCEHEPVPVSICHDDQCADWVCFLGSSVWRMDRLHCRSFLYFAC